MLPPRQSGSLEAAQEHKVRIIKSAIVTAAIIVLVFGLKSVWAGSLLRMGMTLTCEIFLFGAFLCIRTGRVNQSLILFFLMAWLGLVVAIITIGRYESVVMCWWVIFICLAGLMGGRRCSLVWGGVALVSAAGLWAVNYWLPVMDEWVVEENKVIQLRMHWVAQLVIISVIIQAFIRAGERYEDQVQDRTLSLEKEIEKRVLAEKLALDAHQSTVQFFANMSHEIRTPLNVIIGFSKRLLKRDSFVDGKDRSAVDLIHRNSLGLSNLVSEMFELSNISLTHLEYEKDPFKFEAMIDECLQAVEPLMKEYGLQLHYICEDEMYISADRMRLYQAVLNIIYFAIRQTEEGSITLVQSKVSMAGVDAVQLVVSDTGAGIASEHLQNLLETHYQCILNSNKAVPISALALVISAKLIALHSGLIQVASELNQGTVFTVTLPLIASGDPN